MSKTNKRQNRLRRGADLAYHRLSNPLSHRRALIGVIHHVHNAIGKEMGREVC